jgi:hypothetical protein
MLSCPQCKKTHFELLRQCPTCQADLSLLADFLVGVQNGLNRAETHVRNGELGQAVRAYLDVLEIDPENATARSRMAEWARAVRHFDRPSRQRRRHRRRKPPLLPAAPTPAPSPSPSALANLSAPAVVTPGQRTLPLWVLALVGATLLLLGLGLGYVCGSLWPIPAGASPTGATFPAE